MWSADPAALEQLRKIFKATLLLDNKVRFAANQALADLKKQPQFENYLCDLLIKDTESTSDVRAAAGINLKNSVLKTSLSDRSYLLATIFAGLMVQDTMVRNITGNVITSLFAAQGIEGWPQALPQLLSTIESGDINPQSREAAVSALAKICEDHSALLDREYNGERPLDHITSKLIELTRLPNSTPKIRSQSIFCLNQLLPLKSQLVLVFLDHYLQTLFDLAQDENPEVRKNVCSAFSLIMETRPDKLLPHMEGVLNYCVHLMEDPSEEVAMEACEFLLLLAELPTKAHKPIFRQQLRVVLPVLLSKMVFLEEEIFLFQIADEKDDAFVADKAEDIKPNMAKSKQGHSIGKKNNQESDSDDEDSDDDSDDEMEQWNLRRCAASTLDVLSLDFPQDVLDIALPILQQNIVSSEWPVRESAILAFGAISKSCIELASDKLPVLVPFLVERMKDNESKVREISCWAVSRYSPWVTKEAKQGGSYANYFQPTFELLVQLALDPKKIVQQSACSALSTYIENTDVELLQPYVGALLEHFAKCFAAYQRKNMIMLYDCVSTFVDKIGTEVFNQTPEYANTLMPPLLHNWQLMDDDDTNLWPLLECMSVVAIAMGESFAPYAVPVYERAVKILTNVVQLNEEMLNNPEIDAPEKDFIITSLDLIDGLVQGFKGHFVDLAAQHGADLMKILLQCFEDYVDDVRQLAYALLGDLAIFAYEATVAPYLSSIVVCIGHEISNCNYLTYALTNNAIWSCGEIALKASSEFDQFIPNLVNVLIPLVNSPDTQNTVLENAAICLGRFGVKNGAGIVAPRLSEFIYSWCAHIMYLNEDEEKESAFIGMINVIHANPDQGFGGLSTHEGRKNLAVFVSCIGNYFEPSSKLRELFFLLLSSYKLLLGDSWETQVLGLVDGESRGFLLTTYGI
ncbi:CIC11C00000001368 [Sungouiella intermedia]|uniref:CIC11C00000001368 n=1 Tax=Sungouiella intermedia TaxID=45354 RepID=A0A1L0BC88_9ASCO|nr:CIC11C00000001368 [[Candida] intermedia]